MHSEAERQQLNIRQAERCWPIEPNIGRSAFPWGSVASTFLLPREPTWVAIIEIVGPFPTLLIQRISAGIASVAFAVPDASE